MTSMELRRTWAPERRLIVVAGLYLLANVVGAIVSVVYRLPAEFTFDGAYSPDNVLADILSGKGSALVAPAPPLIALVLFAFLARSRRWWGTLGVVGLCALGMLFAFTMWSEPVVGRVFPPSASELPVAVMVALFILIPLAMLLLGILNLVQRLRQARR